MGFRSVRLAKRVLEDLETALPYSVKIFWEEKCTESRTESHCFPDFSLLMKKDHQEGHAKLLTLNTPEMGFFSSLSKKTVYITCVKTMKYQCLKDVKESKWTLVLGFNLGFFVFKKKNGTVIV